VFPLASLRAVAYAWPMLPEHDRGEPHRVARLFRNGRNQAVRIPRELELPGEEVWLYRDGDKLVLQPVDKRSQLLELLARWKPIEDPFPDVDAGLTELDDIKP